MTKAEMQSEMQAIFERIVSAWLAEQEKDEMKTYDCDPDSGPEVEYRPTKPIVFGTVK